MKKYLIGSSAAVVFLAGVLTGTAMQRGAVEGPAPQTKVVLENQRVTITEVTNTPGSKREPYTRPTDQIIVFVEEADYETTDEAGKKTRKHRVPGEIIWHTKGESAPLLINQGKKSYRNLVIALK